MPGENRANPTLGTRGPMEVEAEAKPITALEIIYRDEFLVAVYKPAGLLVHRSEIDRRETRFAVQLLRDQLGQRVHTVHRLDKPTSGLMLFALNTEDATRLSLDFQEQKISKQYSALVRGFMPEQGHIDYAYALRYDPLDPATHDQSRKLAAVTHYRCARQFEVDIPLGRYPSARFSVLELKPKTGRKHQLRRHMKHLSHPIAGDTTYGDGRQNQWMRTHLNCHRLMLCATHLSFLHPRSGETIEMNVKPDASFSDVVNTIARQSS